MDNGTAPREEEKVHEPDKTQKIGSLVVQIREEIIDGCRGRHWHGRAVLLLFFVYIGVRHIFDVTYHSLFDGLNLIIHEGGHLLFSYGGEFIGFAGGTILQLIAPVGSAVMFARQRDYFAISACGV